MAQLAGYYIDRSQIVVIDWTDHYRLRPVWFGRHGLYCKALAHELVTDELFLGAEEAEDVGRHRGDHLFIETSYVRRNPCLQWADLGATVNLDEFEHPGRSVGFEDVSVTLPGFRVLGEALKTSGSAPGLVEEGASLCRVCNNEMFHDIHADSELDLDHQAEPRRN